MKRYGHILSSSLRVLLLFGLLVALASTAQAQVGALDLSFADDGVQVSDFQDVDRALHDIVIQSDGKIVGFGVTEDEGGPNTRVARVARYNTDGSFDETNSFSKIGERVGCTASQVPMAFHTAAIEGDGHFLAGGYVQVDCEGNDRDFHVMRIDASTLAEVKRFDRPSFSGQIEYVFDLALQSDGKAVAVGRTHSSSWSLSTFDIALARYNTDGTIDNSFGTDGEVVVDVDGDEDQGRAVVVQDDDKILVAGRAHIGGQNDVLVMRFNADGTFDSSFDSDGIVTIDFHGFDDQGLGLFLQADDKIVVAGERTASDGSTRSLAVVRLNADGTLDTSFDGDGKAVVDFGGPRAFARNVVIQLDGKLVVAGATETGEGGGSTRDFALARLNPDGSLDTSFDDDGKQTVDINGDLDQAQALDIKSDGDIVLAGLTSQGSLATRDWALARFIGDTALLPVELTRFAATVDEEAVVFTWQTASETDNAGFEVQHASPVASQRTATTAWEHVAFVEGAGTTREPQSYRHRVEGLEAGTHRFRLKQVDFDGTFEYSDAVEVTVALAEPYRMGTIYPNPARERAALELAVQEAQRVRAEVFDVLGRRVQVVYDGELAAHRTHRLAIEGRSLPSGLYLVRLAGEGFTATQRLTVVR